MRSRTVFGALGAVILLGLLALVAAVAALPGGGSATPAVAATELDPVVTVNDDTLADLNATDGVESCVQVGPPLGSVGLTGSASLARGTADGLDGPVTLQVALVVAEGALRSERNVTLREHGRQDLQLFSAAPAAGQVDVGERVRVSLRAFHEDVRVASANRTVRVRAGGRTDCE